MKKLYLLILSLSLILFISGYEQKEANIDATVTINYDYFNLSLYDGWNLASIPLILDDKSPVATFPDSKIFWYNASDKKWYSYSPDRPEFLNTLKEINEKIGFWINTDENNISLKGSRPYKTKIELKKGFNLIGYPYKKILTSLDALSDAENYSYVFTYHAKDKEWSSYDPDKPIFLNTLIEMEPGQGYWIYMHDDAVWIFDNRYMVE